MSNNHLQFPLGETPPPPSPVMHDEIHLAGQLGETTITFPGEDKLTAKQFETKMFDSSGAVPKYDATSAANLPANIPPPLLPGQAPPGQPPAVDRTNAFANITIHTVPVENVCAELKTDLVNGLSTQEHAMRLARDGPNKLTPPKELPWIVKQLPHYFGGFQSLMIVGGILCLVVFFLNKDDKQTLAFGISLIFVVVCTGTFEAYQDNQANSLMNGFKSLTESTATVLRDGQRKVVPSLELVIGDVCLLDGGMKICADLRIMESRGLKVDNSTLTGEPEPLRRQPECTSQSSNETRNLAFSGTFFTEGTGKGIVYACGDDTAIGSISASAGAAKRPETTLKRELRHFVTRMAIIALLIAVTFVVVGVAKERISYKTAIIYFIVGVLANIPEGLLPQLTAQLTLVAKRMKAKNVMVKNLEIIETLGCTSCVASDKTGTLTQNRMTVAHAWFDLNIWATLPNEADRDGPLPDTTAPTFGWLQRCATLCNRAIYLPEAGQPIDILTTPVKGDASETAMLRFVQPIRDAVEYRAACPMIGEIPFNSTNKWALTIVQLEDGSTAVLMKGAPERILTRCTSIAVNGEIVPMGSYNNDVVEANKALARRGERVLAFAWLPLKNGISDETLKSLGEGDPPAELCLDQLCFIGLLALVDPPRVGVAESILQCQTAGIQVIMVTGDHPETARSIAKSINIMPGMTREERAEFEGVRPEQVNPEHVEAVVIHTADELPHFTQEDWDYTLSRKQVVFARSLPAQKQKIVQELQARGHVVAVTGDGTNDCPALRQAAVGVAMGISGSDIAKNAAQVVLLDDNFCSLIDGIREGRLIFHNMKKCIMYTVTHLMPEIIPFFLLILARLPLAMETIMILVIDLGTELMPAIALAWEEGEANFMSQPPRNIKTTRLVSKQLLFMAYIAAGLWETAVCYWGFFWAFSGYGFKINNLFGYGRYWDTKESELKPAELQRYNELALTNDIWMSHKGRAAKFDNFYDYRVHALNVAQAAYIWGLVICQLANILCCRSRYESLFKRPMNKWILVGMVLAVIIVNLITYIPALHSVFGAATLPAEYIFISVPTVVIMLASEELRKFCIRRWPEGCIAKLTDY